MSDQALIFLKAKHSIQPLALISSERYEREVSPGMCFKYFLYNHHQLIFENNKRTKEIYGPKYIFIIIWKNVYATGNLISYSFVYFISFELQMEQEVIKHLRITSTVFYKGNTECTINDMSTNCKASFAYEWQRDKI